jgi:hypothetical protein
MCLTGCLGNNQSSSKTQTAQSFPSIEIESKPIPESQPFSVDTSVIQQYTTSHPAKIRIRLTNTSSNTHLFRFGAAIPFGELVAEHNRESKLYLIPNEDRYIGGESDKIIPQTPIDGCWKITQTFGIHDIRQGKEFSPDESSSEEYTLLSDLDEPCLQDGAYKARKENYVNGTSWGFEILANTS